MFFPLLGINSNWYLQQKQICPNKIFQETFTEWSLTTLSGMQSWRILIKLNLFFYHYCIIVVLLYFILIKIILNFKLHENIEMIQKLGPTFVLHFMLILTYCVKLICIQMLPSFALLIIQLAVVFFNLGIVISVALWVFIENIKWIIFEKLNEFINPIRIHFSNLIVYFFRI